MKKESCKACSQYRNCEDSFASWIFFIIGLIATFAIRAVVVLMHMGALYAKVAWYVGVGGFTLFFIYKFRVNVARSKAISGRNLVERIDRGEGLTQEDNKVIRALLCGLGSKKEMINYMFIFGLSAITILFALYMDFFR